MSHIIIYNGKSIYIHHRYNTAKHFLSNEIIFIDYVKPKKNIVDSLTKELLREIVYNLSMRMCLKPLKNKECNYGNPT
jgi:hypothetical protein